MSILKFTEDHEWLRVEGDVATVGITDYAQNALGDIVFVQLPDVGASFAQGDEAVGQLEHAALALVHGLDHVQLGAATVRMLALHQRARRLRTVGKDGMAMNIPTLCGWFRVTHVTHMTIVSSNPRFFA